jgi:hypothetical protein
VRLGDLPVLVDHVGDAAGVLVVGAVGGAVGDRELAVGVAEEREGEVELLGEAGVVGLGVEANAEDLGVARLVLVGEVPEPGTFGRSPGGVGLRIEPEDDLLPAEVRQLHVIAVVIDDVEIGGRVSNFQHARTSKDVPQFRAERHAAYCTGVTWEERYRAGGHGSGEPSSLLVRFVKELTPGTALDLGCGSGRNAIWLAHHGWSVIGLDSAPTAVAIARGAGIDTRLFDLESGDPLPFDDHSFDLVCSIRFLHRPLFAEAGRLLRKGGIFVGEFRKKPPYDISEGELRTLFAGWTVLHAGDSKIVASV